MGQFELVKEVTFQAAHALPNVPDGHRCKRMHGHSYRVEIAVHGALSEPAGWVMDFNDVSAAAEPLLAELDHTVLNDVSGLENPTSENLARWIFERLEHALPTLSSVTVHETATSRCIYRRAGE